MPNAYYLDKAMTKIHVFFSYISVGIPKFKPLTDEILDINVGISSLSKRKISA